MPTGSMPAPTERRVLRHEVLQTLRTGILAGEIVPGTRLLEIPLAAEFGVSRGPLREALRQLEQEGLVQRQAHPTDGRQILFSLTQRGVEARRQRHAAKLAWLTTAIDRLDADEQRTLGDAIALVGRLGEN